MSFKLRGILIVAVCALLTGCTTPNFLRKQTNRQIGTLTDLMYVQTLDNVALFETNPAALPHFATVGDSTTQLTDGGASNNSITWNALGFFQAAMALNGTRALQENWKLQPVSSAARLRRLRGALTLVVEGMDYGTEQGLDSGFSKEFGFPSEARVVFGEAPCETIVSDMIKMGLLPSPKQFGGALVQNVAHFPTLEAAQSYAAEFQRQLDCNFPRGWYCISGQPGTTQCGCWVGHYCDTYAYVDAAGVEGLSRLTITLFYLAGNDPSPGATALLKRTYVNGVETVTVEGTIEGDVSKYPFFALSSAIRRVEKLALILRSHCDENGVCSLEIRKLIDDLREGRKSIEQDEALSNDEKAEKLQDLADDIESRLKDMPIPEGTPESMIQGFKDLRIRIQQSKRELLPIIQATDSETTTLLDRPGNAPFSRGGGGIEVGPSIP